ncbi:MAG: hypothetical protein MPW15_11635 [Candidatus Manganitrophus sp.]|nr:hypothetical protein [Candidatus Manganitrophus sp.]
MPNDYLASPEFNAAQTVHFYLAMAAEVQTEEMIREALRMKKRVVVPVVQPESKSLTLSELIDLHPSKLQPGPYGISEPRPPYRKGESIRGRSICGSFRESLLMPPGIGSGSGGATTIGFFLRRRERRSGWHLNFRWWIGFRLRRPIIRLI